MNDKFTLKALRAISNLTAQEAAKLLGVSEATLLSWENGKTFPRVNQVPKIEEVYRTKYDNIKFLTNNHG